MKKMTAFWNRKSIKDKYVKRVLVHAKADQIIQGRYWKNGKGCATGCAVHSSAPHKRYESELGIPETVAYLEDRIFEGLSNGNAKKFAVEFLQVIPVGADLSKVTPKFMVWLMKDLEKYAKGYPDVLASLHQVRKLYERIIKGGVVSDGEWDSAAWAAAEAARAAAEAAAEADQYKKMGRKLLSLLKSTT